MSNIENVLVFSLHNWILLWSFYTTFLMIYPISIKYINTIKFWPIISSETFNGLVKLIFNMNYKILNKFSSFRFSVQKKDQCVSRVFIYHN